MTSIIRYTRNSGIEIKTPYNADFINALKAMIPRDCRSWDGGAKIWFVESWYANQAIEIVKRYYADVEVQRYQQSSPPPAYSTKSTDPFRVLFLLPTAPGPVIQAVYRTLARIHHPDSGGDTKTMQQINAAYDLVKDQT